MARKADPGTFTAACGSCGGDIQYVKGVHQGHRCPNGESR